MLKKIHFLALFALGAGAAQFADPIPPPQPRQQPVAAIPAVPGPRLVLHSREQLLPQPPQPSVQAIRFIHVVPGVAAAVPPSAPVNCES